MPVPFMRRIPPFDPTQISGCQLWLDANDTTTFTFSSSSNISKWNDKSIQGNNLLNTSSTYPTQSTTPAGYPCVYLSGSTCQMTSIANNTTTGNSSRTVIMVSQIASGGDSRFGTGPHSGSSPPSTYGFDLQSSVIYCPYVYTGSDVTAYGSPNTNMYSLYSYYNSNSSTVGGIVNFNLTASNSTTLNTSATPWYLGLRPDGGYSITAYVCEIIHYNSILSIGQQQQVEGYLAQKWGLRGNLPGGHVGLTSVIYPTIKPLFLTPMPYASAFTPSGIAGFGLWLDGSDPAGNGSIPSNGAAVSTWVDKSGNGNSGTGTGTYSSSTSNISFNNTPYTLPTGTYISGSGSYTIFSIQSTNNPSGIEYFFAFGPISSGQHLSFPHASSPNPYLSWVGNDYNFTYSMTSGRSFIAVNSYNVLSNYKYGYINGSLDGSLAPSAGRNTSTSPNTLGIGPNGYALNGTLSEILIFSSFLTTPQQQQAEGYLAWKWGLQSYLPASHPYKSASPNTSNILNISRPATLANQYPTPITRSYAFITYTTTPGYLFFLDAGNPSSYSGSGSTWTDLAGSGLTTTLYGSPTYSSANGGYLSFVPGSSQYAQTSASLSLITTWTVEVWHYYNGTNSSGLPCILTEVWSSTPINFTIGSGTGTNTSLQAGYFNGAWYTTSSSYSLPSTGWYHIVGTYDGTNIKLYINNILTQTQTSSTTPGSSGLGIRLMRRWDLGDYWGGYLAIVRIYGRALQASEITQNYGASKARFGLS